MSQRIVYVNGDYLAESDAKISVFDRGFLFADGVYEVTAVVGGMLIDNEHPLARLRRSMQALEMPPLPFSNEDNNNGLVDVQKRLIDLNHLQEGLVYLQVTRGVADRNFVYPKDTSPSLVLFTQEKQLIANPMANIGLTIISVPDLRWKCRDIKTTALLASSMAKMQAQAAKVNDAWMVENGFVTEGTSSNAYIVCASTGNIITRHLGPEILPGITRHTVLQLAKELGIQIEERPFSILEALESKEAFITSASTFVLPVISIDGKAIGDGRPGKLTLQLREMYIRSALGS
jgi:D-alanine transaminase